MSHEAEHDQVRAAVEHGGFGDHRLLSRLLIHFGSKHHYQPRLYENEGIAVLLAWHDVVHGEDDVLRVEHDFDAEGLATLVECRRRYRDAAGRDA